jgi:dTDP-4-amino-4,6-dideoxygalactose transaminase
MPISTRSIRLNKPDLPPFDEIEPQLREIIENGQITNFGKYVRELEAAASERLGTHTATVASCTAGLILSLGALGLAPGEQIVLPSFTFSATAQAVRYAGGIPVFVDIDDDFNLSVEDLAIVLDQHPTVGAVLPIHCFGLPARVDDIQRTVDRAGVKTSRRIPVLYDAAHALGSALAGRPVGGFGDAEVFSMSATKAIVAGEGGLVSSHDPDFIQRIRRMRNYGLNDHYEALWAGLNGKMSEFHAIIGVYNLRRLDELIARRQSKARFYRECLESRTRSRPTHWPAEVIHTFKDLCIVLPEELAPQRDAIVRFLADRGIETRIYYSPPLHEQRLFREFATRPLPRTENLARRALTIPFSSEISDDDMTFVVETIRQAESRLSVRG